MSIKHRRQRRKSGPRFVQLYHFIKRSQAWHDLSLPARCTLIELLDRYTGINNGMIGLGCRELSEALKCSRDTANRALTELDDAGLVRPTTVGVWRGKRATEWRLTFYRCDKTGDLPNKSWPAYSQSDQKDALSKKLNKRERAQSDHKDTYRYLPCGYELKHRHAAAHS